MKYLTAAESARRLQVSDKTIQRWIAEQKLSALHVAKNRLAIPESEIERIARERGQIWSPDQGQDDIKERLAQLEKRMQRLEDQLANINRASRTALQPSVPDEMIESTSPTIHAVKNGSTTQKNTVEQTHEDIPAGSILARYFAEQHGVNARTFSDHIKKGIHGEQVATVKRQKPGRTRETEHWLTPEQQQHALAFWRRHNVVHTE